MKLSCNLSYDYETVTLLQQRAAELRIGPSAVANAILRGVLRLDKDRLLSMLRRVAATEKITVRGLDDREEGREPNGRASRSKKAVSQ